jgi:hypothetical protein
MRMLYPRGEILAKRAACIVIGRGQIWFEPVEQRRRQSDISVTGIGIANALQVAIHPVHFHSDDDIAFRRVVREGEVASEGMPVR